ncbi:neuropeptide-like protein C4orf48 homolog [Carassius carassius]|uniref:neuropeptide-like protein C4orf48 homolog n=1 Tax=Carassius carassius TaxID=217509 RepID=UPI0028686E87|nr:neuropeptide-like protein C4orf48 homolog [Carassius carassius]
MSVMQRDRMRPSGALATATLLLLILIQILCFKPVHADESGTAIPAESRPCVDCHAFEFMQRALQDLKKTAFNLDSRTESLVLKAERRALCDCMPASSLR